MLKRILYLLEESQERNTSDNGTSNECRIYTNKELMKLLGVESRYLKNLPQLQRQKLFSINFRPDFGPPFLQLTEPQ